MRRRTLLLLVVTSQWLFSVAHAKELDLNRWVDRELIPYVNEKLLKHPRFKGETLMFVVLDDNAPASVSNDLTLSLRDRLLNAALDTNGVRIGWQQGGAGRVGISPVDCTRDDVHYYIGLELSQQLDQSYELSVHALDLEDQLWVTGFSKSWRGKLDGRQRRALQRTRVDESFLGAREVPFTLAQTDLLAQHLAHELVCDSLRQTNGDYLVPTAVADADGDEIDGAIELIGNNIAHHSAIEFTADESRINAVLSGKAHQIDGPLYQYWLTVTPNGKDEALTAISASAYVLLPNTRLAAIEPGNHAETGYAAQPEMYEPLTVSIPNAGNDALIGPLRIATPRHLSDCGHQQTFQHTSAYWSAGRQCSLLEASANTDAVVFFLEHQPHLGLVRLGGSDCRDRTTVRLVRSGDPLRFPIARFSTDTGQVTAVDRWIATPTSDTYYAIAFADARSARRVANHIDKLPMRCGAASRIGLTGVALTQWLDDFAMLAAQSARHIDWRAIQLKDVH